MQPSGVLEERNRHVALNKTHRNYFILLFFHFYLQRFFLLTYLVSRNVYVALHHPVCLFFEAGGVRVQSSALGPVLLVLLKEKVSVVFLKSNLVECELQIRIFV